MLYLKIGRLFSALSALIKKALLYIKYDDFTIADHYRKQGAQVGNNCRIEIRQKLYRPHLVSIGEHVFIGRGVLLHTYDMGAWILRNEIPDLTITGKIVIEDNCMIGSYAQLLPNVRIGRNSIVGAGSVVISDIPPNSIAMGVPARVIGSTLKYKEKHNKNWNEQTQNNQG